MNLIAFLKKVDALTAQLPKERLADFIHTWARGLPESERNTFLSTLSGHAETEPFSTEAPTFAESVSLSEQCAVMQKDLERITEGEVRLIARYNEEYDDWYSDESEEINYEDPHGVVALIERAMDLAHQCIDQEEYGGAYAVGKVLLELRVSMEDDGEYDYDDLTLFSMKGADLIQRDLRPLVLETLCAAYLAVPSEQRPETLYRIFEQSKNVPVRMEDVLQSAATELPGTADFLKAWTAYLGGVEGEFARRLFEEAAFLLNDQNALVRAASDYADTHPGLYEKILLTEKESGNTDRLFTLGQEALAKLRPNLLIRSRIALLTAESALTLGNPDQAEQCWLEVFRSNPAPIHYLRLCTECRDVARRREEARNIYRAWKEDVSAYFSWSGERDELMETGVSERDFHTLNFLDGDFQSVLNDGMNVQEPLGWSYTFMKRGITLFLLYLYRGEQLESALRYLCGKVIEKMPFSWEDYAKGLARPVTQSDEDLFWERFRVWRESVPMTEDFQNEILRRLATWMDSRVEGIMSGNHRKYYDECAGFVAALGEVKESRGERGGKQAEMLAWKAKYSRRTAFHQELRRFGMNDGKR